MSARFTLVLVSALAACGGDDGGSNPTPDAPPAVTIAQVDPCPATPSATVTTTSAGDTKYTPAATTITQGQVVKFTMNTAHDVAPLNAASTGLVVPLGGERCYRFTTPGTYSFKCTPHGFTGTITVN